MPRIRPALGLALILAALAGCGRDRSGDPPGSDVPAGACVCEPVGVVDPILLAFLSKARAAHHSADVALEAGDRAGAIRALESIVTGPTPPGGLPEVAEVTADTRARLADLRSAGGDFDEAIREIEAGLALAPGPSHFRGHLVEVRGLVEERRAQSLDERGERDAAERARKAAVASFEEAIAIQDRVIADALEAAKQKPR
jgi:tetratricopeptide (TPR) repeat protein